MILLHRITEVKTGQVIGTVLLSGDKKSWKFEARLTPIIGLWATHLLIEERSGILIGSANMAQRFSGKEIVTEIQVD